MNVDNVKRGIKMMQDGLSLLSSGPFNWYVDQLLGAYEFMMARCCPLKVGDAVMLTRAPDFERVPGWSHCSHFMKPGATGIVRSASCGPNGFRFDVTFDNETWIDNDGVEREVSSPGHFSFGENSLVLVRKGPPC